MATSPTIGIRLSADAQDLQRALNQGSGYIEGFANRARGSMRDVTNEVGRLQSSATSLAGALASLGVGISVGSLVAMVRQVNDGVDALNDLKDATGASIENISALEDVARRSGSSFDTVSTALIKLNQGLNSAKPGSDTEAAIKALGLSVKDLKEQDPAEAFRQIAVSLSGFDDDAKKARITQELFGKSLKEVAPLLKDLAEAGQLNATVTTQQAEEAEKFNKQLAIMSKTSLDVARAMTGPLVSAFNETIAKFKEGAKEGKNYYQVLVDEQLRLLGLKDGPKEYAERLNAISRELEGGNIHQSKRNQLLREQAAIQAKFGNTIATDESSNAAELARLGRYKKPSVGDLPDKPKPKASATDYQRITDELDKQLALATAELEVNRKLTESEKYRIDSLGKITDAYLNGSISADEWAEATAKAEKVFSDKKLFEDTTRQAKADTDAADAHNKYIRSVNEGFYKLQEETAALQEHNDRLGLSKTAVADLDAAKLESQATIQDLIVLKKIEQGLDESQYDIYVKTARELRNQAALRRTGAQKEQQLDDAKEVAKAAAEEWKRGWEETDRLARDAFTGWAENGTSMAEAIGKSLKRALLSAIYEATIRPIALQIYSSIAGGAPGGAAGTLGTLGNGINTASSLNTLWGAGAQFMTGATAGSSALAMTGANAVGAVGGDALGALIAGNGGWAGVSTAASTAGATAGAAASSTLMTTLATAAPYLLAAVAIAALFKKGEYVKSTGSSVMAFDSTGATTDKSVLSNNFATAEADAYVQGIKDSYINLSKSLGATNPGGSFAFAANNSDGGKFGVQVGVGSAAYSTGELKATPEAMILEASRAVFAALQGSELPKYLAGVFDGITATTATADQISAALAYAQNIKNLHDQFAQLPFQNLKDLSLAATKGLIEFSGGLDKLGANLSGYYANFYDEGERQAQTLKNINATLAGVGIAFTDADIAAEDARKKFRALVESVQDLNTENDQRTLAALLSVQGAFADLTQEAKAATTAIDAQTDAQRALQAAWSAEGARLDAMAKDSADRLLAGEQAVQGLRDEATQKYLDAQQRVTDAQRNLADVLHGTIKGFQDVLGDLTTSAAPSTRLATARRNFDSLAERARGGDTGAIAQLAGSAKSLNDLSEKYSATVYDFRTDQARIRNVLNEGIRAGNAQLALLPKDMQQATDPLKAAYAQLAQATAEENAARVLAIAMQASLTSTEKSLGDKYLEAIKALPDEKAFKEFYDNTLQAASDAAAVAAAAAAAAVAILARMTAATSTPSAPAADPGTQTAGTKDTTLHGAGTAMFDTGDISTRAGTTIYASDAIAMANAYAQAHGKDGALARMLELGGTPEMLDRLRLLAGPTASFAVGTNFVPQDMVAKIHKGEAIIPAPFNAERFSKNEINDALVQELKAVRAELAALRADNSRENIAAITAAQQGARTLKKWDQLGMPVA